MNNIVELLKSKNLTFPQILIKEYRNLKLTEQELILLIYFMNHDYQFNPKKISEYLNWTLEEVLETISNITNKNLMKIELKKENNIRKEYINLEGLYQKLAFTLTNKKEEKENNNIFDYFEKEFGRTLSPIEYELINSWVKDNSEEIIKLALKEAVYNGVSNFRYIDKIIHEWSKKGIKSEEDLKKEKINFKNKKVKETFDYDWLNE